MLHLILNSVFGEIIQVSKFSSNDHILLFYCSLVRSTHTQTHAHRHKDTHYHLFSDLDELTKSFIRSDRVNHLISNTKAGTGR